MRDACAFVTGYERARPIRDWELPLLPIAAPARLTLRARSTYRNALGEAKTVSLPGVAL
jgi:Ser/Thr protein kinase RdoA (MazF antagonist)